MQPCPNTRAGSVPNALCLCFTVKTWTLPLLQQCVCRTPDMRWMWYVLNKCRLSSEFLGSFWNKKLYLTIQGRICHWRWEEKSVELRESMGEVSGGSSEESAPQGAGGISCRTVQNRAEQVVDVPIWWRVLTKGLGLMEKEMVNHLLSTPRAPAAKPLPWSLAQGNSIPCLYVCI